MFIIHNYWLFRLFSRHISRTQPFPQNHHIIFHALVALKMLVSLKSRLVACSPRRVVDKQTDRQRDKQTHKTTTVTLDAHARPELITETPTKMKFGMYYQFHPYIAIDYIYNVHYRPGLHNYITCIILYMAITNYYVIETN